MSNKRRKAKYDAYQNLTTHGVNVQKENQIRPKSGECKNGI